MVKRIPKKKSSAKSRTGLLLRGVGFNKVMGGLFGAVLALAGVYLIAFSHAAGSTYLQGIYKGNFSQAPISAFEGFVGHKLDVAEIFLDGNNNPPGGAPPYFTFPSSMQSIWAGRRLIVSPGGPFNVSPNCPGQAAQETYWSKMASGTYDSYVRTLAQNLVSSGHADSIIRMFHEYNGGWFPDCLFNTSTQIANFKKTFQNWAAIYKSTPGENFTIMWNPTYDPANLGSHANVINSYPGDASVDAVGIDVYDQWQQGFVTGFYQTDAVRQAAFNNLLNRSDFGLKIWSSFAVAHGKKLDVPEWGLGYDGNSSGGDDPYFINGMAAFFNDPANNVGLESFWEESDCASTQSTPPYACLGIVPKGVSEPDAPSGITRRQYPVPNSRAAFLSDFKNGAPLTSTPAQTAILTPTPLPKAPIRMRAGGANYTDPSGNVWQSDVAYSADGGTDTQGAGKITGTTIAPVYENERWSNPHLGYHIPIANGTYTLKLHFAEISPGAQAVNARVFSGKAEGLQLFTNLDIFKEVGGYKPDDKFYMVTVSDNALDLAFDATINASKLSGLEILPATAPTAAPNAVPTTAPTPKPTPNPTPIPVVVVPTPPNTPQPAGSGNPIIITSPGGQPVSVPAGDTVKVSGTLKITNPNTGVPTKTTLEVDKVPVETVNGSDSVNLDTSYLPNGAHQVVVQTKNSDGTTTTTGRNVVVNNKLNPFQQVRNFLYLHILASKVGANILGVAVFLTALAAIGGMLWRIRMYLMLHTATSLH